MKIIKTTVFLIVSGLIGFLIYNSPFIWDRNLYSEEISLQEGKVLVISDLHLDSNPRDLSCIGNFLTENNISHLVVNGDIFDVKSEEKFEDYFLNRVRNELAIKGVFPQNITYVLAPYNHDPDIDENSIKLEKDGRNIAIMSGILKIKTNDSLFYIFHGDYFMKKGAMPFLLGKLSKGLLYERLGKLTIGAEKNDWVIMAHSHIPGIDYERKVANSGSWINRGILNTDTGILIEVSSAADTKVNLVKIPCE